MLESELVTGSVLFSNILLICLFKHSLTIVCVCVCVCVCVRACVCVCVCVFKYASPH